MRLVWTILPLVLVGVIGIQEPFAESTELETRKVIIDTVVHKIVDGKPVIEKQEVEGRFYVPPPPALDGCEKTAGWVPWDPDSQHSKIMPDLQEQIDEGYDELCIVIVLPFEGKFFGKGHDLDTVLTNLDSVTKFLEDNDAIVEKNRLDIREYIDKRSLHIGALVPTSLISELVERDDVVSIDMYGKMPFYPYHVTIGLDSKIYPGLQTEINSGKEQIPIAINFPSKHREPSIETGYYLTIGTPLSKSEIEQMQEPVVMLLENNDAEIIRVSPGANYIIANVPASLILELEKIDDIISMAVFYDNITIAGTTGADESDNQLSTVDGELTVDIELTVDSAKLSISGDALNLKEIPVPYELLDKKLDVTINNIAESDFEIISASDGPTIVFEPTILQSTFVQPDTPDDNFQFKSPLQQTHEGVSFSDIQCKESLIRMAKHDGSPACVKPSTVEKLIERGWTSDKNNTQEKIESTRVLYVDSELVDCVGVVPQQCMWVKEDLDSDWAMWYVSIDGFDFQEGTQYKIRITSTEIENPPADRSSWEYTLVDVLEQSSTDELFLGRNALENERRTQCINNGGEFGQFFEAPPDAPGICSMPTSDAGKTCTDSNQCESVCYDPKYSKKGSQAVGECYSSTVYDCIAVIENGTVVDTGCS